MTKTADAQCTKYNLLYVQWNQFFLLMTANENLRNPPCKWIFFKLCGYPSHKSQVGNYVVGSSIRWKGKVLSKY